MCSDNQGGAAKEATAELTLSPTGGTHSLRVSLRRRGDQAPSQGRGQSREPPKLAASLKSLLLGITKGKKSRTAVVLLGIIFLFINVQIRSSFQLYFKGLWCIFPQCSSPGS